MDKDTVEYYIKKLNGIKERIAACRSIRRHNKDVLSVEILVEVEALHIKRILEEIAFCFMLAIGDKAIPIYLNFTKFRNVREYVSRLGDFNLKYYPHPVMPKHREDNTIEWVNVPVNEYLAIDDFQNLYEKCTAIVSPYILGSPKIDLSKWDNACSAWLDRICSLLSHHAIKIQDSAVAMLFSMNDSKKSATAAPYSYVDENEILDAIKSAVPLMDVVSLNDHLSRQINYLRRSCDIYDAGNPDEAIRLAVTIRTLVHDTPKSVSLLHQLEAKNAINVPTSFGYAKRLPENFKPAAMFPILANSASGGTTSPFPLSDPPVNLPLEEWWNEIVWIQEATLTRKQIVLNAANKEGGAHIEANAPKAVKDLRKGLSQIISMQINGVEVGTPANYHFVLLRQFAHELLNCQRLLELGRASKKVPARVAHSIGRNYISFELSTRSPT
jgi:hypothetical protein